MNSSEIFLSLQKLKNLSSVLYIAAHPDDENTAALTYFSKHEYARTGYLSITRGDGGQNLIGAEQAEELSIIRTYELLEARKVDGAEQFFTRAIDFGYSKSADETFRKWNKEELLGDVVWVIRNFKPDIIITRFPTNGEGGHGQHTASAILAEEAFYAAADSSRYPEHLEHVSTWRAKKLFWNAWPQLLQEKNIELNKLPFVDVGEYNALLGRSYTEISAQSRSMHKSQGFGAVSQREENINYFMRLDVPNDDKDLFDAIQTEWNRVEGSEKISIIIDDLISNFDFQHPDSSISGLVKLRAELKNYPASNHYVRLKLRDVEQLILNCSGLWLEATADKYEAGSDDSIIIKIKIVNRASTEFRLLETRINESANSMQTNETLQPQKAFEATYQIKIGDDVFPSQPFWLANESRKNFYDLNLLDVGKANSPTSFTSKIILEINGEQIEFTIPVYYRWVDPINGEMYRSVEILPQVAVSFEKDFYLLDPDENQFVNLTIKNRGNRIIGKLSIKNSLLENPILYEEEISINKGEEKILRIAANRMMQNSQIIFAEFASADGRIFDSSPKRIIYPHFLPAPYLKRAKTKILSIKENENDFSIAYLVGSGDEIPSILLEMGYKVDQFKENEILEIDFSKYKCVIGGIRFLNTNESIKKIEEKLFEYAHNGGTLIYQYNTLQSLKAENCGPQKFKISRSRVAEEDAEVRILNPDHQLLNFPNKISKSDFDGWIQERGLYFPAEWNENYETVISMNDKNELPLDGSILYLNYGKGKFIYTSLSFFRQLPALVPGAIKLFQNMIHANEKR